MLTTPFDKIKVLAENKDSKYLCTVGIEGNNKESIIIWDISKCARMLTKINILRDCNFGKSCKH